MDRVVVIAGPTASGKTALSVALAQELGGEIVSADSMQVYCGMDIGTAKATSAERGGIAHHMLDVAEPDESYSAARYVDEAAACCEDILARGKLPIITGGTGLYIDSLLSGRSFAETEESREVRRALSREYDVRGGEAMLEKLRLVDPARAAALAAADKRRIVRALEIYALTGETATAHDEATRALPPRYGAARIVLCYAERARQYAMIDSRVDKMVREGLFDEVAGLLSRGVSPEATAMQAIGYKETAAALHGELTAHEAVTLIKQSSRRYAKRQLTWFRRWEDALWIRWSAEPDFLAARQLSTAFMRRCGIS